jgi:hypothetical protein
MTSKTRIPIEGFPGYFACSDGVVEYQSKSGHYHPVPLSSTGLIVLRHGTTASVKRPQDVIDQYFPPEEPELEEEEEEWMDEGDNSEDPE